MKLVTDIQPRGDGTVSASVDDIKYVFRAGDDGRLTADVGNQAHADFLTDTGNFYPATESDAPIVKRTPAPKVDPATAEANLAAAVAAEVAEKAAAESVAKAAPKAAAKAAATKQK